MLCEKKVYFSLSLWTDLHLCTVICVIKFQSVSQAQNTAEQTKEANTKEARKSQNQGVSDQFELASKLNKLAGQKGVARTQFSNAEIAELVKTFAGVLKQNPTADRLKRARLFAASVRKGKKLKKLFGNVSDAELEEMFELIAEQLEGSPFFAQLLEDVCDETLKTAN